jgi:MoxR-like ATPase
MTTPHERARALQQAIDQVILGRPELTRLVVASFLAGGHVLLEGLPGLGKTVLARALAHAAGLGMRRVQFTPDLMPTDITGTHVLDEVDGRRTLRFIEGPVFTHFLLADEINRASPRTQAALLEAMAEGTVSQLGETHPLPRPFFVIATQNPIDMEGTNPLPEAQLDRFAVKIQVGATRESTLLDILGRSPGGQLPLPAPVLRDVGEARALQAAVDEVLLAEGVKRLISRVVARSLPDDPGALPAVREHVRWGASPRGAIWLARLGRALALLDGRQSVGFEDVAEAAPHVLGHRLILRYTARLDGLEPRRLIEDLLRQGEQELGISGG